MYLASTVICFMTNRGASSDSFATNVDTDFGPFRSLLLNSMLLNSLYRVRRIQDTGGPTLELPPPTADSRIVPRGFAETPPLALIGARSMTGFGRCAFAQLRKLAFS